MYRIFIQILITTITFFCIVGCSSENKATNEIKVGTISGPETEIMEVAREVALKKYNLHIKLIEFSDYSLPNAALNEKSLDANVFQHQPYLEEEIKNKHYDLAVIGKTFIYPMGVYSKVISKLSDLKRDAIVAIPNDPTNEGRALLLLQKAGLIKLKVGVGFLATPNDIVSNMHHIKIREIDTAQLPRVLTDVDLAVINTNYAALSDLYPNRDALFIEDTHSPYANLIVVRKNELDRLELKQLVEALHSVAVKDAANVIFKGQAFPAWK